MSKKHKQLHKTGELKARGLPSIFQLSIPDELRMPTMLDASGLRSVQAQVIALEEKVRSLQKHSNAQKVEIVPSPVVQVLGQVATNAWRAKMKMIDPETREPKEEMRRIYRHIEAIFEAMESIDIKTVDPVGKTYDSGMALKVISFDPTPGISREEIKETIKPSVVWQGRLIQMGEVIVGKPEVKANIETEVKHE